MAWHPFRHVGLKILALALGTLLWLTVSGHQIERNVPVPLAFSNMPASLEMTGDQIDSIGVRVRGPEDIVSSLGQGNLRVIVDLSAARPGANLMVLRVDEVVAPAGIEVLQVDPGAVTVTLERSGQIEVPVRSNVEGQPAAGFVIRGTTVEPATVVVIGPESRLKQAAAVVTERVSVDGRTADVVEDVSVGVTDAELRLLEPRTVRVRVKIERERGGR